MPRIRSRRDQNIVEIEVCVWPASSSKGCLYVSDLVAVYSDSLCGAIDVVVPTSTAEVERR